MKTHYSTLTLIDHKIKIQIKLTDYVGHLCDREYYASYPVSASWMMTVMLTKQGFVLMFANSCYNKKISQNKYILRERCSTTLSQ